MGIVVPFRERHARTSAKKGRGTFSGHSRLTGHCSENQNMTASYLRAVKVVEAVSTRSKKRQSPAAKRPKVVKLMSREAAYAEAQAMRFERNSDSIETHICRSFPTVKQKVGDFQLAESPEQSDKSAMGTVGEVRHIIQQAFDRAQESPITLALEWELERNQIRDFLEGKKDSLKPDVILMISEHFGIPLVRLIIERPRKKKNKKVA